MVIVSNALTSTQDEKVPKDKGKHGPIKGTRKISIEIDSKEQRYLNYLTKNSKTIILMMLTELKKDLDNQKMTEK